MQMQPYNQLLGQNGYCEDPRYNEGFIIALLALICLMWLIIMFLWVLFHCKIRRRKVSRFTCRLVCRLYCIKVRGCKAYRICKVNMFNARICLACFNGIISTLYAAFTICYQGTINSVHLWRLTLGSHIGSSITHALTWINLVYFLRLKRIQVQLKDEHEQTNKIYEKITKSIFW